MTGPADALASGPGKTASRWGRLLGVAGCVVAVLLCEFLVFRYLFRYGVSNVWHGDGFTQHFPALLYYHDWVTALLGGTGASHGVWSWHLGLGADSLNVLSYYLSDPFALLSLPFPTRMLEYVYEGTYFLRLLCAGLAGYYYLRTVKASKIASIAGTLVYVFSAFTLVSTLMHPYFANAMIWFPLILVGIEQVLARRRWYLLTGAVFLAAFTNFYFFYQLVLIAVIYAVARWAEISKSGERLRNLLGDAARVARWFALGTALAACSLVPIVLAVLASSRDAAGAATPLLFSAHTYKTFLVALITARMGDNFFAVGMPVFGFIAAGIVILRPGNRALKAMLAAFAAIGLLPFLGRVLNGFSFPGYRGLFMVSLFLGAAIAVVLTDRRMPSRRELIATGVGLLAFSAAELWATRSLAHPMRPTEIPLVIGALAWALLLAEHLVRTRRANGAVPTNATEPPLGRFTLALRGGIIALLVAAVAFAGTAKYSAGYDTTLKTYVKSGTVGLRYWQDPGARITSTLRLDGVQRVDKQQGVFGSDLGVSQNNDPLAQGYNGIDFYFSLMDDGLHEYMKGLADRAKRFSYDYEGFDDRAVLDTLNSVRYYLTPSSGAAYVPYGFVRSSEIGTDAVYENRFALPVGYVYHSAIASDTYAAMAPLDKQQALLQGVVLPTGTAPNIPRIAPASETIDVTYTLTPDAGLSWDTASRSVTVRTSRSSAALSFAPVPDAELYLQMTGVKFTIAPYMYLGARGAGPMKLQRFIASDDGYFWGGDTLLVNLGYYPKGTTEAHIMFVDRDTIRYSTLRVIAVPMARYPQRIETLAAEGMSHVVVGADSLSGTVTSKGDGLLFLSVPYSTGWTATVDGASAPILKANLGFCAIPVGGGMHSVQMRYTTPGLRAGLAVSVLALLVAIGMAIATERRAAASRRLAAASDSIDEA